MYTHVLVIYLKPSEYNQKLVNESPSSPLVITDARKLQMRKQQLASGKHMNRNNNNDR